MTGTAARSGSELCSLCGLCCDGTIFTTARLAAGEVEAARGLRLPVIEGRAEAVFTLPCPRHEAGACAIYEARPAVCRAFVCLTLGRYVAGEIDLAEAEARVGRLRAVAAGLRARLPEELRGLDLWLAVDRLCAEGEGSADPAAWRRARADLLLDVAEAEHLCRRDFVPPGPR